MSGKHTLILFSLLLILVSTGLCRADAREGKGLSGLYTNGSFDIRIVQQDDSFTVYLYAPLLRDTFSQRLNTTQNRLNKNIYSAQAYSVTKRPPLISSYTPLGSKQAITATGGIPDLLPAFRQAQLVLQVRHVLHTPAGNRNSIFLYGFQKTDDGSLLYLQLPGYRTEAIIDTFKPAQQLCFTNVPANGYATTATLPLIPPRSREKLQQIMEQTSLQLALPEPVLPKVKDRKVYTAHLDKDWNYGRGLDQKMCLLSLQGLLNRDSPTLFFVFPDNWTFNNTPALFEYYRDERGFAFIPLDSNDLLHQVLQLPEVKEIRKEYILWDNKTLLSLNIAQSTAAIAGVPVISKALEPQLLKNGFRKMADFSGPEWQEMEQHKMQGPAYLAFNRMVRKLERELQRPLMNDSAIFITGEHGNGSAMTDYAFARRMQSFCLADFKDCSGHPDPVYLDSLLQTLKPFSTVCGWHLYDPCSSEENFVSTVSSFGHIMLGLASSPNTSFYSKVPVAPSFTFKNNKTPAAEINYLAGINKDTILLAFVQTDGIGLGTWNDPLRGTLPYSWDVACFLDYYPSYIEFYYSKATSKDYFLASPMLTYTYPRSVPAEYRKISYERQNRINRLGDIDYGQIYEPSTFARPSRMPHEPPNLNLPEDLVREVWASSNLKGILNGYYPASTFAKGPGAKTVISYAYYLDARVSTQRAVADFTQFIASLETTAELGLVVHVRESNSLQRVVDFLQGVQKTYPVKAVQIDALMEIRSRKFTYKENFLDFSR